MHRLPSPRRLLVASLALSLYACREAPTDTPPQQVAGAPFHYPEDLWDAGVEGQTTLRLFVSRTGTVDSVALDQTSGQAAFDSAAVAGARDLRFEPARRGTDSVGVWVLLPVRFDLPSTDSAADSTGR